MQLLKALTDPRLAELLRSGAVGVMPTDTIYGLVCAASNESAVARLYALKSRERKPGTIIAATIAQIEDLGVAPRYLELVRRFWPGPVSVRIPVEAFPYLHQGVGHGAFRVPDHSALRQLLEQIGPLLTTSANAPGQPPAATRAEAETYFGRQVDFYVDGGKIADQLPSTVVRLDPDGGFTLLRQGAATINFPKEIYA